MRFTGLRGEELANIYSADFFLSDATDTFGNVVLEAQASGLPVIVSDVGDLGISFNDGTASSPRRWMRASWPRPFGG
jgi:glycosyltransferase involved in cell wall biosynthesis